VNPNRVRRLMRLMGLQAIYPKRRPSASGQADKHYPYLLAGVGVAWPNQRWSADITNIRLRRGFLCLVAILGLVQPACPLLLGAVGHPGGTVLRALEEALSKAQPEFFNTNRGTQFTSEEFTGLLDRGGIAIRVDGRGRVYDNIFVGRLWHTVKYQEVYMKDYADPREARTGVGAYLRFYNEERPHQAIGYRTPAEVYEGRAGDTRQGGAALCMLNYADIPAAARQAIGRGNLERLLSEADT